MIRISYERYTNDYCRQRGLQATFPNLASLEDWIFGQMKQAYDTDKHWFSMYFPEAPNPEGRVSRISFTPEYGGVHYWIHAIFENGGILFSDGQETNGVSHMGARVRDFCKDCNIRRNIKSFNFID